MDSIKVLAGIALVFVVGGLVMIVPHQVPASELPVLGEVGSFRLIDQTGRTVTERECLGWVWIADFIFTNCAGPCPTMTHEMSEMAKDLAEDIGYVSFSVDPRRDTPAALAKYAAAYGAPWPRWCFLTGDWPEIDAIIKDRFHLTARPPGELVGNYQVMHDLRFALVDRHGRIRGYYVGTNPDEVKRLRSDATKLVATRE